MKAISDRANPFDRLEVDEDNIILRDGKVPLIHWPNHPNFGDDLSPWLIQKISGFETIQNKGEQPSYVAIGSIINRVTNKCSV